MNDKLIINTISKIYFIITSFLLFIFLTLSVVFIILQNGLYIETISLPNIKAKQLYIKWNESLDISIQEVKILQNNTNTKFDLKKISKQLKSLITYYDMFEKVVINKVSYNDIKASFKYVRGENGYITASSPNLKLHSSLFFEKDLLNIQIDSARDKIRDINVTGNIILNTTEHTITTDIKANIHNEVDLNFLSYTNQNKMYYQVNADKEIKSIAYTMELLGLDEELKYWAYKAITFSSISVKELYGWVDFKDLDNGYKNLYVHATGHDLHYKYNKKLDAIHTKTTDVIFQNGSLYIYPKQAHTYKSKLGKSWIQIDFTQKEELLTLKLLFDGKLDKDTLGILKAYKIKLPFLQNSGKTKVDLTLDVNLRTIDVNAKGEFFSKKANFKYLRHNIDIFNAYIKLDNYDVRIDNMLASYKDIFTTKVDVSYDAKQAKGEIDFKIKKINFADLDLSLNVKKSMLKAKYLISPNKDKISVAPSQWKFKDLPVNVKSVNLPFNLNTLLLKIPSTVVTSPSVLKANVSGFVNLNKMIYDFDAKVSNIYLKNISLKSYPTLKIKYNEGLTINTNKRIDFKINSLNSFVNKINLEIKNNILTIDESYINIDEIIKTKFSTSYSLKEKQGIVKTKRLRIKTATLGDLYLEAHDTNFDIAFKNNDFIASSKDLGVFFLYNKNLWKLDLDSATRLARNSKLLQKYNVTKGNATIYKKRNDEYTHLKSTLYSSNKVMVQNNIPLDKYFINGKIDNKTEVISLNINENVNVTIDKDVDVKIHDIGINMNALVDIIDSKQGDLKNYSSAMVNLNAKNTYLYLSDNRRILSENINIKYAKKALKAQLRYREGLSSLQFKNGVFHIEGKNFNDEFMENLFALSKFKNGAFKFKMSGTPREYDGLFTINDATLIDYKILNNILAFVNTIPALVTFSTPSYSSSGLDIQTAYMKMHSKNDILTISDLSLDSKELDILGSGNASFKNNTIDVELNLKTDLGSAVSKVPLVGYLLMDKDSISTTLKVSGTLNDPKVGSLLAKEIAVAPLNILLRTITLPYYLITSKGKDKK